MRDRRHVDDRHVVRLDTGRLVVAGVGGILVLVLVFLLGVFVGRSLWAPPALPPELAAPLAGTQDRAPAGPADEAPVREPPSAVSPPPEPELTFYRELKKPVSTPEAKLEPPPPAAPPRETAKPEPHEAGQRKAEAAPPAGKLAEAPPPVFTVQVGSFRSRADAERFLAGIRKQGVDAEIVEASVAGRTWYRVQAGRFRSRTAAAEFQESVLGKKGIQGFVTTR